MLRDGVCDDATNNEKCHWDGGDCCADKSVKDDFFCKVRLNTMRDSYKNVNAIICFS